MTAGGVGDRLGVFLGAERVGSLEKRGPTRYRFAYDPAVLAAREAGEVFLSASLPVRAEPFGPAASRPFFDGLLPEASVRERVAAKLRVPFSDGFALLSALGADVAGAVVVLPDGQAPAESGGGTVLWLTDDELASRVADLPSTPLAITADGARGARLSLGGVQGKLVLTRGADGTFGLPRGGTPSTHILKPGGEFEDLVTNELFCMRVARSAGLRAASVDLLQLAEDPWLLVQRFDREEDAGRTVRVHQEDFCQALGREPAAKYEKDGGPSFAECVQLIRDVSDRAVDDVRTLLRAMVVNVVLGNSDAHGKNFGLLYGAQDQIVLAPLYDVVCTNVYDLTTDLAMAVGGEVDPERLNWSHWRALARDAGLGWEAAQADIRETARRVLTATEATSAVVVAEGWHRPVVDRIAEMVRRRAGALS